MGHVRKLDPHARPGIFLGVSITSKGWRVLDLESRRVLVSRDVRFDESIYPWKLAPAGPMPALVLPPSAAALASPPAAVDVPVAANGDVPATAVDHAVPVPSAPRRSSRVSRPPKWMAALAVVVPTGLDTLIRTEVAPRNQPEVMALPEPARSEWLAAQHVEIDAYQRNRAADEVLVPNWVKLLRCVEIRSNKRTVLDELKRKYRVCADGSGQIEGRDYTTKTSPTATMISVKLLLMIGCEEQVIVHNADADHAYPQAPADHEMLMALPSAWPSRFLDSEVPPGYKRALRLLKAIYGLVSSGALWWRCIRDYLIELGWRECSADICVFIRFTPAGRSILLLFSDDILLKCPTPATYLALSAELTARFEIKLQGRVKKFLGLEAAYDAPGGTVVLHQATYVGDILARHGLAAANPQHTPAATAALSRTIAAVPAAAVLEGEKGVLQKQMRQQLARTAQYKAMLGALQYTTHTRPDCAFAISACGSHSFLPSEEHLTALKRIFRYQKKTQSLGLKYTATGSGGTIKLSAYVDASFAENYREGDARSRTGFLVMINDTPLTAVSVTQKSTSFSTSEAEYQALAAVVRELVWIRALLDEMGYPQEATPVYEDNSAAIDMATRVGMSNKTKHVVVRHACVREAVARGDIVLVKVATGDQLADGMTKGQARDLFESHVGQYMGEM